MLPGKPDQRDHIYHTQQQSSLDVKTPVFKTVGKTVCEFSYHQLSLTAVLTHTYFSLQGCLGYGKPLPWRRNNVQMYWLFSFCPDFSNPLKSLLCTLGLHQWRPCSFVTLAPACYSPSPSTDPSPLWPKNEASPCCSSLSISPFLCGSLKLAHIPKEELLHYILLRIQVARMCPISCPNPGWYTSISTSFSQNISNYIEVLCHLT